MTLEMALDAADFGEALGASRHKMLASMPSAPIIKPGVRQKIEDHGLTVDEVQSVLAAPEQLVPGQGGRLVVQSRVGRFLVRVILEQDRDPPEVVTAYRTSHIQKYWQVDDAD